MQWNWDLDFEIRSPSEFSCTETTEEYCFPQKLCVHSPNPTSKATTCVIPFTLIHKFGWEMCLSLIVPMFIQDLDYCAPPTHTTGDSYRAQPSCSVMAPCNVPNICLRACPTPWITQHNRNCVLWTRSFLDLLFNDSFCWNDLDSPLLLFYFPFSLKIIIF